MSTIKNTNNTTYKVVDNMNVKIYLVGGAVRDRIIGVESKDLDYVIIGLNYNGMKKYIVDILHMRIVVETPNYGVIRAIHPKLGCVDFALPRIDVSPDGRQSEVKFVKTIEEDLARRDFTMNAIALLVDPITLEETTEYIDPFDGKADISNKLIRFVGDPVLRIQEDELRVLRALRFSITKSFRLDPSTIDAIFKYKISNKVSNERIFEELNKMFAVSNSESMYMLYMLTQTYLLDRVKLKATT